MSQSIDIHTAVSKEASFSVKGFLCAFFTVVAFVFMSQQSYSQVSTYSFAEANGTYTALASPSVAYAAPWDDHTAGAAFQATIGFNFSYNGVVQTQCYISPNGFISFGVQPLSNTYLPLSVATAFTGGGTISALGMDLLSTTDNITYSTIGSSPNRVFVVQWTNARRKAQTGNFNFQIRLVETTNSVEFSYGACAPDDVTVLNTQVGIRGVTNDFSQGNVQNRLQNGANTNAAWSGKTITGNANSSTVRTSVTEYPNNGLKYIFTPPPTCTTPTGVPSAFVVGGTAVNSTSFTGNSFTAASPAPTNYLILRSNSSVPPTATDIPNGTYWSAGNTISGNYAVVNAGNVTTFNQISLTPNTMYYYWVIPYNAGCLGGPLYNLTNMVATSKATCIAAPTGVAASAIDGNTFTASWAAVAGATNYQIDVSTNTAFTAILPAYTALLTGNVTSYAVTGLDPLTTYYFRIRAVGVGCALNSSTVNLTTTCGAYNIPYFQNFDTTAVNAMPACCTITDDNANFVIWRVQNSLAASTPNSLQLATNSVAAANDWFFTPGLNLTAGVTYRLKFKYNTQSAGTFAENLRVRLGSGASEAGMNSTILDLSNIINTVYQNASVDFTPVTNSVFYLGFQGYSFAGQSKIMLDDISVIVSPTCFEPTALTVTSVGITTAGITWEPSSPEPDNGYEYYVSTSNVTPSGSVTPTGTVGYAVTSATIPGLNPATLYYVWVRGKCNGTDRSVWSNIETFSTDCAAATLLSVTNGTLCGGGSTTLTASGASGSTIEWYAEAAGTTLLFTGNSFVTPTLSSTTTYYAQSKAPGGLVPVGPISPLLQGGALGVQSTQTSINFSVAAITALQSFDIYPMVSGQNGTLIFRNAANVQIASYSFVTNVAGGNTPQTITFALDLPVGNYSVYFQTMPAAGLVSNIDSATYPYVSSIASIDGNGFDGTFYLYAYNWKFSNICRSLLTPVTATVTPAPAIGFSSTASTICQNESTGVITVTGAASSYSNFTWNTTAGLSGSVGAGFTFQPSTTTTYSLTASQSSGSLCSLVISHTVNVKPEPPAITIVPASPILCPGSSQLLSASLAAAPPVTIYTENFNAATNNWVRTNTSTGGTVANSAWTLRTSPYAYASSFWNVTVTSNDSSQFYFTNSDSQGSPGTNRTQTYLQSPSINLAGYTTASLNFYHYLRYIAGNKARVEVSTDGGTNWSLLMAYTASQGAAANFANATVNMDAYVGYSNVKIRFFFEATWDYGWAIDNVKISGTLAVEVSWTPPTGLYFDATAGSPYIAGTPTGTVYAKPTVTTTYTGSVLGANGCSTSGTATVTVVTAVTAGTLSSTQSVCGNWAASDLTLAGATGTIARWEYATDAAFTVGVTAIANTTATLASAAIGTFTGTRYYRVVIQNGSCPLIYSNTVSINFPSTTWNGTAWSNGVPTSSLKAVFSGNYSSTGNLDACGVEVLSGNVVFNSNHTLTVQNDVKVTAGSLVFEDKSSLVQVNTLNNNGNPISNTGNITYKRVSTPIKIYDYIYWSSPVIGQTLQNFSPNSPLFFYYDPAIGNWAYANTTALMTAGKGYLVRTPEVAPFNEVTTNTYTGSFIGVPNTGNISIAGFGGSGQFNLFGNPYPSALSANAFLSDAANVPLIDATIYLWTHNTPITANNYTSNDYALYNYAGGVGTGSTAVNPSPNSSVPNGKIAAGQGFFVKGLSSGNVMFKNSMRLTGNNDQFFRMNNPPAGGFVNELERHRFWLDIFNATGDFKQLLVAYIENATNTGLDRGFDGEMLDAGNPINFYVLQEDKKLSIQGRALPFNEADVIPLGYKSNEANSYQVKLSNFDGLFDGQLIYLEDMALHVIHDLKAGDYQFTTEAGTFENRFRIVFKSGALGVDNPVLNENSVVIYKNNESNFVVTSGVILMENVKVFDIRGRLLMEKKDINATQTIVSGGLANEVLLIQVTTADGVVITKKVVR